MRSVQHVDCRSAVALALPLLVDRRQANTAAAAAVAAVTVNAIATSSFVSVAVQAALVEAAAAT